jgi:hypothetical protein
MTHLQESVTHQSLVDTQHGVLIDRQLAGQLTDRRQPMARLELPRRTIRGNLTANLPRDRYGRAFFDAKEHLGLENQGTPPSDYSSVTVVTWGVKRWCLGLSVMLRILGGGELRKRAGAVGAIKLRFGIRQTPFDLPYSLTQSLFVLYERHPQETFAGGAETAAGAHRNVAFF